MTKLNKVVNGVLTGIALAATLLLAAVHVFVIVVITIVRAAWRA